MIPRALIGVYLIRNTITGAVYVGSSARSLAERLWKHRGMLRAGNHSNTHLQSAWNKYGSAAFTFDVIEYTNDKSHTLAREQYWLDHYRQMGVCYNFSPTAGSNLGWERSKESSDRLAKTWAGFCGPDGVEYRNIHNLARFCREHGLQKTTMEKLGRGVVNRTDTGWTRVDDPNTYAFVLRAPDGTVYDRIFDLLGFCAEHGLNYRAARGVISGERAAHHGWTRLNTDRSLFMPNGGRKRTGRGVIFSFIAPDGMLHENIDNLTLFADRHGLSASSLHGVHTGKCKQHKGWRKG